MIGVLMVLREEVTRDFLEKERFMFNISAILISKVIISGAF